MIWDVSDEGRITVRLRAEGVDAVRSVRDDANRHISGIVSDLATTCGIDAVTDEIRFSVSKTRPEVTVTWRAQVPAAGVMATREYLLRLSASEQSGTVQGEIVDGLPDQ